MYSNELQLELNGGNCMDKIAMVKKEIQLQNWSDKELARQESGLTVTEWCTREKISTSAYYYRLRRIRENRNRQCSDKDSVRRSEGRDLIRCSIRKDRCDDRCIEMLTEMLSGATVYVVTGYAKRNRRSYSDSGGFCR